MWEKSKLKIVFLKQRKMLCHWFVSYTWGGFSTLKTARRRANEVGLKRWTEKKFPLCCTVVTHETTLLSFTLPTEMITLESSITHSLTLAQFSRFPARSQWDRTSALPECQERSAHSTLNPCKIRVHSRIGSTYSLCALLCILQYVSPQ